MQSTKEKNITWVCFFRHLIDELWHDASLNVLPHRNRWKRIDRFEWRKLPGDYRVNGYRRRTWKRLCLEKYERISALKEKLKSEGGHCSKWVLE